MRCDECKFWEREIDEGSCKILSPRILLAQFDDNCGQQWQWPDSHTGCWPVTSEDDWCGEFVDKSKEYPKVPTDTEIQEKFVTDYEMAEISGTTDRNLRKWAKQGKIPSLLLPNGKVVFNPNAVINTLKGITNDRART